MGWFWNLVFGIWNLLLLGIHGFSVRVTNKIHLGHGKRGKINHLLFLMMGGFCRKFAVKNVIINITMAQVDKNSP